jgi:hypothetical protein
MYVTWPLVVPNLTSRTNRSPDREEVRDPMNARASDPSANAVYVGAKYVYRYCGKPCQQAHWKQYAELSLRMLTFYCFQYAFWHGLRRMRL